MPGLLHLPTEVLTLIVEEVCITAELDNLGQTVTVELKCPPGDVVDEGVQRHPSLNALGGAQVVRYSGSRSDIRHQRDQLEALLVQRFREQSLGRVVSDSFLHGVHGSHRLEGFFQSVQAEANELILNHRPDTRCLLALASACRLLRACAEPFLYRVADLYYGNPCAYAEHLGLLLRYPHLTRHVRLLSFSTLDDEKFENDPYGFLPPGQGQLAEAVAGLVSRDGPVSREEIWRSLGPERFGSHGLHPSMFRAMLLFLLPDVQSLKIDLAFLEEESLAEQTRREWLFRALLQEPNDVWAAGKVPALRNLQEFSLILRDHRAGNAFDPRLLLPFLLLPKMRTFYTSLLNTGHHFLLMSERERSQWSGKSAVTEMIFDFVTVDGFTIDSLLRLPSALEKLTLNSYAALPSEWAFDPTYCGDTYKILLANRVLWYALWHQRHSLRRLTIRWANNRAEKPLPSLKPFTVLEELTVPLAMPLHNRACETTAPRLRQVTIEHRVEVSDGPASKYELDAEAVISLGRQVGVEVLVDFVEYKVPEFGLSDTDEEDND
ncbi:hypothetical protein INS49_012104 [Diaporthe citri]|uniref:uncharacterized protein n=1 Tax=Diaporthe citri TaxID=83186 RepID=UPI001C807214|nr:uncharacterized protein INS49_012104 [Diaporthe citri]KAG6358586.1 hypothetical protein INS49_012104 [Diaporthe citri]